MSLKEKLAAGEFVLLAELEPPKGVHVAPMLDHARRLKERVEAFLVPEMHQAVMRMSALGAAFLLRQEGMEPVMQVCCRDRNRLALQGDLLAAFACGIENLLVVSGEDPSLGDHHRARAVYDLSALELLEAIGGLERGRDLAGVDLEGAPRFFTGATTQAGSPGRSAELEAEDIAQRMRAGARFFLTPPIFDPELLEPVVRRLDQGRQALVPTVLLLKSLGMARYIERNVPHIRIPPETIERLQRAPDKVRECVQIAVEGIRALRSRGYPAVAVATLGWEDKLPEIVEAL